MSNFDEKVRLLKVLSSLYEQNFHCASEIGETLKSIRTDLGFDQNEKYKKFKIGTNEIGEPVYENINNISQIPTKYLNEELVSREGIEEIVIDNEGEAVIEKYMSTSRGETPFKYKVDGASKILVNKD